MPTNCQGTWRDDWTVNQVFDSEGMYPEFWATKCDGCGERNIIHNHRSLGTFPAGPAEAAVRAALAEAFAR